MLPSSATSFLSNLEIVTLFDGGDVAIMAEVVVMILMIVMIGDNDDDDDGER